MKTVRSTSMAAVFAFAAFAGAADLFAADHTLPWSYDDSAHPADVKAEVTSQPLATVFDTRWYLSSLFPFTLPPGLLIMFR